MDYIYHVQKLLFYNDTVLKLYCKTEKLICL